MTRKTFASYSWTTPEYKEWVRALVDRLRGDGVDVILDVYRLKEGHDKYVFMEQMVTNPEVSKVLVISNQQYAEKADARQGGVGTESLIISREIYEKVDQQKFIPVVTELDEEGKPYLPIFMKGRIYIDLSSEQKLHENYEQLLRAIFDKPIYQEPVLGKPPSFLTEEGRVSTRTGFKLQMIKEAVLKDKPTVKGLVTDYLRSFAQAVQEDFRFRPDDYIVPFGDKIKVSIHRFLPYRDEFIDFILFASLYIDDETVFRSIFKFFEQLLPLKELPPLTSGFDHIADNFRFILREMFLYMIAALIKNEKFEIVDLFLRHEYFNSLSKKNDYDERHVSFTTFSTDAGSIEVDRGLSSNQTGILLRERAYNREVEFTDLIQADLVLFLRSILHRKSQFDWLWFPKTLYGAPYNAVFPLFIRAESQVGFDNLKKILGVSSKEDIEEKLNTAVELDAFRFANFRPSSIKALMNLDKLNSRQEL